MDWRPISTAPRDGTMVRLRWKSGAIDIGRWRPFADPEHTWEQAPWTHGYTGEWDTENGNATLDDPHDADAWSPIELEQQP